MFNRLYDIVHGKMYDGVAGPLHLTDSYYRFSYRLVGNLSYAERLMSEEGCCMPFINNYTGAR